MKLVYTNEMSLIVGNARNLLENAGIEVVLRNEYAGGVVGEVSAFDAWPELWVVHDRDYDRACTLLDKALSNPNASDWLCQRCHEHNDAAFEICWNCNSEPGRL